MRYAEQRLPAFIFPSFPEKGSSLFLGELVHPQLACEILINLRFSDLSPKGSVNARFRWRIIIGSVICGHIYAVCYRIKQRNNAFLLTSVRQSGISCALHH